jgi:hypothetical protein
MAVPDRPGIDEEKYSFLGIPIAKCRNIAVLPRDQHVKFHLFFLGNRQEEKELKI